MEFDLVSMWNAMGLVAKAVVVILLAMSMYSIGITIERLVTFKKGKRQSLGYIGALAPLMNQPGKIRDAVGLDVKWKGGPVAKVIGTGVNEYVRGLEALKTKGPDDVGDFDLVDAVNRSMERVKDREIANLRRGLSVLATVASSAPFVGLFGTVFGIINSFRAMSDPTKGGGGIATVSAGISEALLTTAVGLAVAIVAVWFFNFFTGKVDDFTVDIDETASELIENILKEGRTGPGAVTRALHTQPQA